MLKQGAWLFKIKDFKALIACVKINELLLRNAPLSFHSCSFFCCFFFKVNTRAELHCE